MVEQCIISPKTFWDNCFSVSFIYCLFLFANNPKNLIEMGKKITLKMLIPGWFLGAYEHHYVCEMDFFGSVTLARCRANHNHILNADHKAYKDYIGPDD